MWRVLVAVILMLAGVSCRSAKPLTYQDFLEQAARGPLPCAADPCFADTLRPSPTPAPCPAPVVDSSRFVEYRNEFNDLRLTLPGRYQRGAGPAWRFERLGYSAGDTHVDISVDSTDHSRETFTCASDCPKVKELRTCTEEIDGRPTRIETSLIITPEHFPPRRALYVIEARTRLKEGIYLVYLSRTPHEDIQLELLAALRRLKVPPEFP